MPDDIEPPKWTVLLLDIIHNVLQLHLLASDFFKDIFVSAYLYTLSVLQLQFSIKKKSNVFIMAVDISK